MKHIHAPLLALFTATILLASGCVKLKQTLVMNPDGRGKVSIDLLTPAGRSLNSDADKSLDEMRRDMLENLLESDGVDAWENVNAAWTDNGRLHITGTAYFSSLKDLDFADIPQLPLLAEAKEGEITVRLYEEDENEGEEDVQDNESPDKPVQEMTDEQIRQWALKKRAEYQSTRAILLAML